MAPTTVVLAALVVVSLVFTGRGYVKSEHLGGSDGQELLPVPVAGGAFPASQCGETRLRLYRGPCVEMLCAAACLVEMRQGGHCKGKFIWGHCYCFSCS